MKILAKKSSLSGEICVPGSKSHTIRALLLACLANGTSHITNPLESADCISAGNAIPLLGAKISFGKEWEVLGAGENIHLPNDVVNVGNSGSLLYFLSAIAATFDGYSVFTGDASIRKRPVLHVVDALNQLGAEAFVSQPGYNGCPLIVKGPVKNPQKIVTEGSVSSQYITGLMMSACRLNGVLEIELTNPKETPYLTMTKVWLEKVGIKCEISSDFHHIKVWGPAKIKAFNTAIPSDWEGVAFPLIAALVSNSEITINNVDSSGTQGDDAIVEILKSIGADIEWDKTQAKILVRGGKKARNGNGRLSTQNLKNGELHINISEFPDAVCALACIACFTEGTTFIEDADVCRKKETDRLKVMTSELKKIGADIEEKENSLVIKGHSPVKEDGSQNPQFTLHSAQVESYDDHRVAMSLASIALGLPDGEKLIINDAECCSVSFPNFFDKMNALNAEFEEV